MKVSIVNNFHPFIGIGKFSFNLYDTYNQQDKDVEMVYMESGNDQILKRDDITRIKQRFNLPFMNKTFGWYYYFPQRIPRNADAYHISSWYLSRACKHVSPTIVSHMDLAPVKFDWYPWHHRFFTEKVLQYYDDADILTCMTPKAETELLEMFPGLEGRTHVVNLGFDEDMYFPISQTEARRKIGIPKEERVVMYVGAEDKRKNVPTLLKAMQIAQEDVEKLSLLFIGEEKNKNVELKSRIKIHSFSGIPEKEMHLYYNAADIFVFPAIYEGGMAYPPIEAMACGTPTIVTEECDIFKKGAHVVNDMYDSDEYAETIVELLTNEKKATKLGKRGLTMVNNEFTLEKCAAEMWRVYEQVL